MASKYDKYSLKDCTHWLNCGDKSGRMYQMPCLILDKWLPRLESRVLVFGDRYGNSQYYIKTMRIIARKRIVRQD